MGDAAGRLQSRSLGSSAGIAAAIALIPIGLLIVISFAVYLSGLFQLDHPSTYEQLQRLFETFGYLGGQAGPKALDDASWIVPSMLAILIGVFASDYGARKRLSDKREAPAASTERRVLTLLKIMGAATAAFAFDYIALAVLTVCQNPGLAGHLLGVIGLGIWIIPLGIAVGIFFSSECQATTRSEPTGSRSARPARLKV
jgi:hypothetical protein